MQHFKTVCFQWIEPKKFSLYNLLLVFLIAFASWHITEYYFLTDDAFITFRYAENFVAGHGFVFNPGEYVEGYTNFFWLLLLLPFAFLGIPLAIAATILSIAFSFFLLFALLVTSRLYLNLPKYSFLSLLAPLFLVLNRTFAIFSTSGLETRAFTFFVFVAFVLCWLELKHEKIIAENETIEANKKTKPNALNYFNGAGFFLALATLTRPEGLVVLSGLSLLRFLKRHKNSEPLFRHDISFYLWAFIPVILHFGFRLWSYGEWFPNTYYVKVSSLSRFDYGYLYFQSFFFENGFYFFFPWVFTGFFVALKKDNILLYSGVALTFLPYLYFLAYQGGDHFEYRPLDVILPFLLLFTVEGIVAFYHWFLPKSQLLAKLFFASLIFILGVYTFLPGYLLHLQLREGHYLNSQIPQLKRELQNVSLSPWILKKIDSYDAQLSRLIQHFIGVRQEEHKKFWQKQQRQAKRLKQYIAEGKIKNSPSIALECVGVIPYYSMLPTLDILGLTDSYVAHLKTKNKSKSFFLAHEKRAPYEYIEKKKVVLFLTHQANLFFEKSLAVHQYGEKKNCYYARFSEKDYLLFYSTLSSIEAIQNYFTVEVGLLSSLKKEDVLTFKKPKSPQEKDFYGIKNGSFETGDLTGWHATGNGMQYQPTYGNNIAARYFDHHPNYQGLFWLGTYEATTIKDQVTQYQMQGNEPQGTLTSEPFLINKPTLSFQMGGGVSENIYLEFLIQSQAVYRIFNQYSTDEMRKVQLDLSEFQGQMGQIRIVDQSSERWGHINVDDFRLTD